MNGRLCILHVQQYVNPWNGRLIITLVLMLRMVPSVSVTLSKHVSASLRRSGTHAYNQRGPDNVSYLSPSTFLCWQTVLAGNKVAHRETVPAQIMKFGAMLLHWSLVSDYPRAGKPTWTALGAHQYISQFWWVCEMIKLTLTAGMQFAVLLVGLILVNCKKIIPRFQVSDHVLFS